MFIEKYLNKIYLDLLYDKYEEWYINQIDENKFNEIYNLFKEYNVYYIEDIIINYLEIFEYEKEIIEDRLLSLKERLGGNFISIIGNDLSYLDEILDSDELEEY